MVIATDISGNIHCATLILPIFVIHRYLDGTLYKAIEGFYCLGRITYPYCRIIVDKILGTKKDKSGLSPRQRQGQYG